MEKASLIAGYEKWFSKYVWLLFGTLTFRGSPSFSKADRIFRQWISEMKQEDGADDFRWVRVTEHGAFGDNIHFHVLIGGLRNGSKWPFVLRWAELAGEPNITYYHIHGGALRYMLKTADPDLDFEIEMELPPTGTARRR